MNARRRAAALVVLLVAFSHTVGATTTQLSTWWGSGYSSLETPADATNVIAVAAGDYHVVALRADGTVLAWGQNNYGQTNVPPGLTNVVGISAGSTHSLALLDDGTVVFWGDIYTTGVTNPPLSATNNMVQLALGGCAQHALSVRADGAAIDWGNAGYGLPTPPPTATNIVAASVGSFHALVLLPNDKVVDWGQWAFGGTPTPPSNATNVAAIAAGGICDMVLRGDGSLVTWGLVTIPAGVTNISAIAAGYDSAYALRADGALFAWPTNGIYSPALPASLTNVVSFVASSFGLLALTASDGPPIVGRPLSSALLAGTAFRYSPIVLSTTPVTYQWMCAGTNLPAATNAMLVVSNAQLTQSGAYALVVSNAFGAVTNSGYNFTVQPLLVQTPPQSQTVAGGTTATFTVSLVGKGPFSYQWHFNGSNLPGATASSLVLTDVQFSEAGLYNVVVSNSLGAVTSPAATLGVAPLFITGQPQSLNTYIGGQPSLGVSVSGTGPFSYQWQFNRTNIPSATSNPLVLANAQLADSGLYSVIVSNAYGAVASSNALLTVVPILITGQPQSQAACLSQTVTLSIAAQAGQPLTYQWQLNGTNIPGAVSNNLTLPHCEYNQSGTYQVLMGDSEYNSNSVEANLSVFQVAAWGEMGQAAVTVTSTNLIAIACGEEHALALDAAGFVYGWGENFDAQATPPAGLSNVIAIAAGNETSLALKKDGTVVLWGYNGTNVPAGLSNVVAIAAGDFHELALMSDGTVTAWGNDVYGQTDVPPGLSNVVAIAGGEWNSMALRADGVVFAWGAGTNDSMNANNYGQSEVPSNLSNVVQIATGGYDDLALQSGGSIVGWGANLDGEDNSPSGISNVVAIAGGLDDSLALRLDGTVVAWGNNALGETDVPTGLTNVFGISADGFSCLALVGSQPPSPYVPIASCAWTSNGFKVSVPSRSGRTYALEYEASLTSGVWSALPLAAGTGGLLILTDSGATNSPQRFYRVCRW